MAKPHIHNLITNILTTEVASAIGLVVPWKSSRPTIVLNLYKYKWLINDDEDDDDDDDDDDEDEKGLQQFKTLTGPFIVIGQT